MLNKFASLTLVFALICTPGGPSTFAGTPSDREPEPKVAETPSESRPVNRTEAKSNEKLKADVRKLVVDAKAGKVATSATSQIQPARRNNWSTGTKIAVGVGVAVAVVVVILIVTHDRDPFPNVFCKSPVLAFHS